MDISKLTITGFKSFYEKSVFTFDKNITAIVGPNGSGKSNITEAIRFVLGEQSSKNMRGRDSSDLLFRGNSARSTKAVVTLEFKKNKNDRSIIKSGNIENIFVKNALEKDIINLSRAIYADGKSEYMMNGVEIRVKDIQEFLLYIHLGNKSSWHMGQGEADKVLLANSETRKSLIEDALGLKVYHARINESLKKLEKTSVNIREATLKRKEIIPELNMLGNQVQKIKRSSEFRIDLEQKAQIYLNYKNSKINILLEENNAGISLQELNSKHEKLQEELKLKEKSIYKEGAHDTHFLESELAREEKVLKIIVDQKSDLENKQRSINNNLEYLNLEDSKNSQEILKIETEIKNMGSVGNDIVFSESFVNKTKEELENYTEKILNSDEIQEIKHMSKEMDFSYKKLITTGVVVNKDNVKQITYLQSIRQRLQEKLREVKGEIKNYQISLEDLNPELKSLELKFKICSEKVEELKKQILEFKYLKVETEREAQKINNDLINLQNIINKKIELETRVENMNKDFELEMTEFKEILGKNFKFEENTGNQVIEDAEAYTIKKSIERLKIRLEESIISNPDEVIKNFEDMTDRDNFLIKEIDDLTNSIKNLEILINDLKINLKQEFEMGLVNINNVFDSYVKKLFGGGGGKVFITNIEPKNKNKNSDSDEAESDDEKEDDHKTGVDIEVIIPNKKVKGLHSLSGGERALVSIALNFSIINQNPSPFMILDETDATLDEANAKRYGEILEMLKQKTKLIVVTHNRETMHFADEVYGVTLGAAGHSKVLSVSFSEAIEYAK